MSNKNNWRRIALNPCACGCGAQVAKKFKKGHGRRRPLADRFMEKIDKTPGCWLWTGAVATSGYGRISDGDKTFQAHRVAYELAKGPIPDELHIDHLCRNRLCVRPSHLEAVTQAVNNERAGAARTVAVATSSPPTPALSESGSSGATIAPATCAHCASTPSVIRQEYDGDVTEPMRQTTMTADRLTSRAFVLAEEI